MLQAVPLEEYLARLDVELLSYPVEHITVYRITLRNEVPWHLVVDRDQGRILGRDEELVVVLLVAVGSRKAGYLAVGAIQDHVLALAVSCVVSLPPGEHHLTLVCLRPEVHHIHTLVLQEAQPHGLSVVVEDHAPVLPRTGLTGSVLRGDEDVAGSSITPPRDHLDDRRVEIRTRAEAPRLPRRCGCGGRPARGTGSQPRVPPSATHAAAAACRNLLRVILELKLAPYSRSCTGYCFAHLPGGTQGPLFMVAPGLFRPVASHPPQQQGVPGPLSDDEVDEPSGDVNALAELFALEVGTDPGARQSQLSGCLFRDVGRGIYTVAQLAVDLDYERYLLSLDQGFIIAWPRLLVHRIFLPHRGPQLLGVVRRERAEDRDEGPQGLVPLVVPDAATYREQVVGVLHERGDGRIEAERLEIVCDLLSQAVRPALQLRRVCLAARGVTPCHEREGAPEPARDTLYALAVPGTAFVPRTNEHQEAPERVGAEAVHVLLRVDHVAPALAHLLTVGPEYVPLVAKAGHGLVEVNQPKIAHNLGEEAGVEQVQNGVLYAAGVLVDGEPLLSPFGIERPLIVVRREVTVPVPRGVHESVHRVRLACGRAAATGTLGIVEVRVELQWRFACGHELGFLWEQDRQVFFRDGDDAALVAEDYGDRGPPVALAADQPVVKPVGNRSLSGAALLEPCRHLLLALGARGAVEPTRVDHRALASVGLYEIFAVPIRRRYHGSDLDAVLPCELEISLVVTWDGHDRARTVAHQDVVGDVDGDLFSAGRVDRVGPRKYTGLFPRHVGAVDLAHPCGPLDVGADLFGLLRGRYLLDRRMLRAHNEERGAEERVRAGGEDLDWAVACDLEPDLGTLGAPDPVPLQRLDPLGPVYLREVQRLLGVVGDPEEPLRQVLLDNRRPAPLAAPVWTYDLLPRQRRVVPGAPVDRSFCAVRQSLLEELHEEPLVPAVVLMVAGHDLGVEVEHRAHLPELAAHALDVRVGPFAGLYAPLDRGVLGGQPEGVEAYREEHPEAVHPHKARSGVRGRHRVPVPDVQITTRVREHRERVVLGLALVLVGLVQAALGPPLLPAAFEIRGVVCPSLFRLAHERLLRLTAWGGSRSGEIRAGPYSRQSDF